MSDDLYSRLSTSQHNPLNDPPSRGSSRLDFHVEMHPVPLNEHHGQGSPTQMLAGGPEDPHWSRHRLSRQPTQEILAGPADVSQGKTALRRELWPMHTFGSKFISIGAVIGMGFYVRTGAIEAIGGPAAVLFAFAFLGVLSLMVMQSLATLLRIWPIRGALMAFTETLVDKEVGMMVGWLYWLTYCFSFAGLTTTIGDLVDDLKVNRSASIAISFFSLIIPVIFNLMDIRIFKWVELALGMFKVTIAVTINLTMMAINWNTAHTHRNGGRDVVFRPAPVAGWFGSVSTGIFYAAFSFVGIEAVAVTAMEVEFSKKYQDHEDNAGNASNVNNAGNVKYKNPFRKPARMVPLTATFIYLWGAWIVTENIAWDDDRLFTLAWSSRPDNTDASSSIFVNSARDSSAGLGKAITIMLILSVASTSSTALYIASRSLYGLALRLAGLHKSQGARLRRSERIFQVFARKNKFGVPYVSVLLSAWLFWVPFLKYTKPDVFSAAINIVVEMGSVSCVLVWSCTSFAAARLFQCCRGVSDNDAVLLIKNYLDVENNVWYYSQTIMAFTAAFTCLLIVVLGGIITYLHQSNPLHPIAAFSILGLFFVGTLVQKVYKRSTRNRFAWKVVDLGSPGKAENAISILNEQRKTNLLKLERPTLTRWDLGGIVDSDWVRQRLRSSSSRRYL